VDCAETWAGAPTKVGCAKATGGAEAMIVKSAGALETATMQRANSRNLSFIGIAM